MSQPLLETLFAHKAWANARLVESLRAAPAEADRRQMAVILHTLDHTGIVDRIFKGHLAGEGHAEAAIVSGVRPQIDELGEKLAATDAWYCAYAARVTEAELSESVTFAFVGDEDEGRMTRAQILSHVITHGAAHRGAIGKMMELAGVPGAPDMVTTLVSRGR